MAFRSMRIGLNGLSGRSTVCRAVPDMQTSGRAYVNTDCHRVTVSHHEVFQLGAASTSGRDAIPTAQRSTFGFAATDAMVVGLVLAQVVTLTGSLVGGHVARKRRLAMEELNNKLRCVVSELRRRQEESTQAVVCEADPEEGVVAYQKALEASMSAPAADHPSEAYGLDSMSLSTTRRSISKLLLDAKELYRGDRLDDALSACDSALALTGEIADKRAERAVLRLKAKCLKASRRYPEAVAVLELALLISKDLDEYSGDVDTLGSLADVYVELGDFEKASKRYDEVIEAIQLEDFSAETTTWDC